MGVPVGPDSQKLSSAPSRWMCDSGTPTASRHSAYASSSSLYTLTKTRSGGNLKTCQRLCGVIVRVRMQCGHGKDEAYATAAKVESRYRASQAANLLLYGDVVPLATGLSTQCAKVTTHSGAG